MSNEAPTDLVHFTCPQCAAPMQAPAGRAGERMSCPACQATVPVPAMAPLPVPAPVAPAGEAPAPAVVSEVAAIPAPQVLPTPAGALVAGESLAPTTTAVAAPAESGATVPVEMPAQDMNVAVDPAAAPPPAAAAAKAKAAETQPDRQAQPELESAAHAAPEAARATASPALRHERVPAPCEPARPPARLVVAAFAALVFIGAAALIGISIHNGIERSRVERDVKTLVEKAETSFADNDINRAAELADKALKTLDANNRKQLNAEMVQQWKARSGHFLNSKSQANELQAIYEQAEQDPLTARSRLVDKKSLLGPVTADNRPLVSRVEGLLLDVAKLELKQKQARLHEELQKAEADYKSGQVEDAAIQAGEIARRLSEKPAVQDPDLEKRLNVLRKRGELLKEAKDMRLAARSSTYAEAKRRLQAELEKLDDSNADLKPLYQRIASLKNEVLQEEKRSHRLDPEEAKKVKQIAGALAELDPNVKLGQIEGDGMRLTYAGKPLRVGVQRSALSASLFLEAEGYRYLVDIGDLFGRDPADGEQGRHPRPTRVLTHIAALSEAMKQAGVASDEIWSAAEEAPFPSARRTGDDGKEYIFLGDRVYVGKPVEKTENEKEVEADFVKKTEALAVAVENDAPTKEEVRPVVAVAVRAAGKEADWFDHLPGDFVRKVINEGYIEKNMPGSAERLKKELAGFRAGYAKISTPQVRFRGVSSQGDEAVEKRTYEERAIWEWHNKAADTTTFAIKNPDDERGCLFILYDFPGKLTDFPANEKPKTVRMTHQSIGVTATYDMAANKLTWDQNTWDRGVVLESPIVPDVVRLARGLGPPGWCLPPHVLLVDLMGDTKALVTPYGRLDMQNFNEIADPAKREAAMNAFLKKMAQVLPTPNYLHLYYRYFSEYILPSPITWLPNLLGSRAHSGNIHQPAFECLGRFMGGRLVGHCVNLAELFQAVTRLQGKLSYIMDLPQHAACGWVEKPPADHEYAFYVLQTGPVMMFQDKDLDKVVEKAYRAFDEDKTMRVDPKSLAFLFRFAGEPTRTPYLLSSRMYVDPVYGEIMERVQSYWHFSFYALGIKTMTEMIEKGDRVPENCMELAGLYQWVREPESSIRWSNEAIKQFTLEQATSRMNEEFRIASMWRLERDNGKSYAALKGLIAELQRLDESPQSLDYHLNLRLEVMGLLSGLGRPWEAWDVVARDMFHLENKGQLKIEHAGGLTGVYEKMQRQIRAGKQPAPEEREKLEKLEKLLDKFYARGLFEAEDDFGEYMRKYACLGLWYAGKYGHQRLVAELLKDGPFPDPAKPRVHADRKDPEAEDWKWIRLPLHSYDMAIADALDIDEPPEKWRREEAVKLADAMLRAAAEARKFGSLGRSEFALFGMRVYRDFLFKDWNDFEAVLKETAERDWSELTQEITETLGQCARFVTPEEFVAQYKVFAKYIKPRTAYFAVVYEAYRADAIEHAVRASKVALECWPGDEDMKREAQYLEELARKKLARPKSNSPAEPTVKR